MKKYLSLSLILISWCLSYSQSTIGYPTIDTYIEIANPSESFSSETGLKLKHTESESNEREILLKFLKDLTPSGGFEQVLLKLVKTGGDEGNVSVVGTSSEFGNLTTWNSAPNLETPFAYGGIKEGEALYLDVTEYINAEASTSSSVFAFKLFTNSIINSPIVFGSNESLNESDRPQLQFYSSSKINVPLYDIHGTTTIDMDSRGKATGEIIKDHNEENAINNYGGWEHGTSNATGFFRAEKDCDNTWHLIDPDGHFFYSAGLNSVDVNGGLSFPNDLNDLGINTLGSWSDETIQNIAYSPRFNVMASFKNTTDDIRNTYSLDILPVFETGFKNFCEELAEENVTPYKNDPWVLGYFLDNELPFHKNQLSLSLELSSSNAQYIAADNWMSEKYGSGYSTNDVTNNDEADYQGYVAETYFEIVTKAFRAVDPNHMLIGTRLHGGGKYIPQLFEASGKYVDVVSVNYYSRFEPEEDAMQMWIENADKPFMITEFYVKGEDTGLDNSSGAGWKVGTQEDRAKWFENWMLKLLRNKGNVGFHWFRFIDRTDDDSNKGLYDDDYNIYEELAASIEKISKSIYTLRSQILYGSYNYNGCSSVNVDEIKLTELGTLVHITKRNAPDFAIDGGLGGTNTQNIALSISNTADAGQLWVEIDKGGDHFTYVKYGTNYCIDGGEGGARNQNVHLWNNEDSQNQQWKKIAMGDGSYKLIKRNKDAYAINGSSGGKEGQNINLWESASTSQNLQWYVKRLVHITKRNAPGFAIDGGLGGTNRQNVTLSAANTADPGQIWVEIDRGNGYHSYEKYGTNYSLDGGNGGATNQSVYLWQSNAAHQNQQWQKVAVGDGSFKLIKRNASGFAINGGTGGRNGQDINLYDSKNTSQNLQWFITPITASVNLETSNSSESNKEITTLSELNNVVIYPNPVISTTTIENAANSTLNIYDINGKLVFSQVISNESEIIDLSSLTTEVYFAEITNKGFLKVIKLIKN